jgi:hypothetical protein
MIVFSTASLDTLKMAPNIAVSQHDLIPDMLLERSLSQVDMATVLYDEFQVLVSLSSISRALTSMKWTKKATQRIANERDTDLRDFYLYKLSAFRSHQLVYVDESGCDKRIGFKRTGWSPLVVAPAKVTRFHSDRRFQILPAYTQDGVLFSIVFRGSTDGEVFEDFVE